MLHHTFFLLVSFSCTWVFLYRKQVRRRDISREHLKFLPYWNRPEDLGYVKIFKHNCNWGWTIRIASTSSAEFSVTFYLHQKLTSTFISKLRSSGWKFTKSNQGKKASFFELSCYAIINWQQNVKIIEAEK